VTERIALRRRPHAVGDIGLLQLVVVELAVIVVGVAVRNRNAALVGTAVVVALVAVALFVRRDGRWLPDAGRLALSRRRRGRGVVEGPVGDPRLAGLRRLAPQLTVQNVETRHAGTIGVGYDGDGWFVVAAVGPSHHEEWDETPVADTIPPAALAGLVRPTGGPDEGLAAETTAAVQVVALRDAVRSGRSTWVTVRLEARLLAGVPDNDPERVAHVPPALLRLARRLPRALDHTGFTARLLDADGLLEALAVGCGLPHGDGLLPSEEAHGWWAAGGLRHVAFWIEQWPPSGREQDLLEEFGALREATTAVTYRLQPAPDVPAAEAGTAARFDLRGLVRVVAPPDRLEAACDRVQELAQDADARLFRLDGEHGPAVYATAPTGGGPR
jgi:type VII secretion protein EccE